MARLPLRRLPALIISLALAVPSTATPFSSSIVRPHDLDAWPFQAIIPHLEWVKPLGRPTDAMIYRAAEFLFNPGIQDEGISHANRLLFMRWLLIKPARLPRAEKDLIAVCSTLSAYETWDDLPDYLLASLKALALRAMAAQNRDDLGVTVLNVPIFLDALWNAKGVFALLRRVHPYTLRALRERGQYATEFTCRQGQYFALYAEQLLGQLPPGGQRVVFAAAPMEAKKPAGGKNRVNDANWPVRAVEDELASSVILLTIRLAGKPAFFYSLVRRDGRQVLIEKVRPIAELEALELRGPCALGMDLSLLRPKAGGWDVPVAQAGHFSRLIAGLLRDHKLSPAKIILSADPGQLRAAVNLPEFIRGALAAIDRALGEEFPSRDPYPAVSDADIQSGLEAFGRFQKRVALPEYLARRVAVIFAGFAAEMRFQPKVVLRPSQTISDLNTILASVSALRLYPRRGGWSLINLGAARRLIAESGDYFTLPDEVGPLDEDHLDLWFAKGGLSQLNDTQYALLSGYPLVSVLVYALRLRMRPDQKPLAKSRPVERSWVAGGFVAYSTRDKDWIKRQDKRFVAFWNQAINKGDVIGNLIVGTSPSPRLRGQRLRQDA